MAKGGRRIQILYSPCHMSLTSQAHEDSHGLCVIPLSVPTVKQLTQTEFKNTSTLAKGLNIDTATESEIETLADKAQAKAPTAEYYGTGSTIHEAATTTAEKIENNGSSLPAAATEKTDRTAVVENVDNQKLDVYKINLRKAHKVKAGMTYLDNHAYLSTGYQAGKQEGLIHFDNLTLEPIGGTITYTVLEW